MQSEKTERPILFSGPLVRAILAGEKTQTRRLIHPRRAYKVTELAGRREDTHWRLAKAGYLADALAASGAYPVGTLLWVRETWGLAPPPSPSDRHRVYVHYAADDAARAIHPDHLPVGGFRLPQSVRNGGMAPSIFMPRWASRITLRVTSVRLERLQDITDADIRAEGIVHAGFVDEGQSLREAWAKGWDGINGGRDKPERPATWASNPWVIVYGFERVEAGR